MRLSRHCYVLVAALSAVLATIAGYAALPIAAQAAPPAKVTVSLSSSTIVADGQSQTRAIATVTDSQGHAVTGQSVSFASTPAGPKFSATAAGSTPGTYTATITSTTTVGEYAITAKVAGLTSPSVTLTQTAGRATKITLTLTPATIVANGHSTAVATATVTDALGHPVSGDSVSFRSSDPGQKISATAPGSTAGTYTATITSSTTVGQSTISAFDLTAGLPPAFATLTQTNALTLLLTPSAIVADGQSKTTASAEVLNAQGHPVSGDIVVFSVSDSGVKISPVTASNGTYSVTLTSSTTAGAVTVTATDLSTGISVGTLLTQVHGPASHVAVVLSSPILVADGISTSTATISVADAHGNAVAGDAIKVSASDNRMRVGAVAAGASGVYTVALISSNIPRTVTITATDASASPAVSGSAVLTELFAPSLAGVAKLRWSFFYTPRYTLVQTLALQGSLRGSIVLMRCHGRGCPFAARQVKLGASQHCVTKGTKRSCSAAVNYDVGRAFRGHRLSAGAVLVVDVLRSGWIGKYYAFRMRSARGPQLHISCLPPGERNHPGSGCQTAQ